MRTRSNSFFVSNGILTLSKYATVHYHKRIKQSTRVMFFVMSKAPSLQGLPKVHKETIPIRPLVDYTMAPNFKVAKKT